MKKSRINVAAVLALLLVLCMLPTGCAGRALDTQEPSALTNPQSEEETAMSPNSAEEPSSDDLKSSTISEDELEEGEEEASGQPVTPNPSTPGIAPLEPSETAPKQEDVSWVITEGAAVEAADAYWSQPENKPKLPDGSVCVVGVIQAPTVEDGRYHMGYYVYNEADNERELVDEVWLDGVTGEPVAPVAVETLPAGIPETLYLFAGTGWMTQLHLNQDGSFSGRYDSWHTGLLAMEAEEELGIELPNGLHHTCEFTGQFRRIRQVSEVEYVMELSELNYAQEPGGEEVIDGALVDYTEAIGLSGATVIRLYLPGRETTDFSEQMSWWITAPNQLEALPAALEGWYLYNVAEDFGFYSE